MDLTKRKIKALKKEFQAKRITVVRLAKKYKISRSKIYSLAREGAWKRERPKPKIKRGRPEKYREEFAKQATALCMLGYTNEKLAEFFEVNKETIYEWKNTKIEFSNALRDGREKSSAKVAVSLFKRACGYSHKEEKIFCQDGKIIRAETVKHYPPDTKAMTLWLKNKYPEFWSDNHKIEGNLEMKIGKITNEDAEFVKSIFDDITE